MATYLITIRELKNGLIIGIGGRLSIEKRGKGSKGSIHLRKAYGGQGV